MGFVQSEGSVQQLSRPAYRVPARVFLTATYSMDYAQIFRSQPSVRRAVEFLARNIAQLGIHMFERRDDADRARLTEHPLAELLDRPNPYTTRYRMINALVHDFAIYDCAYWLKVKGGGSTRSVVRVPPMIIEPAGENWLTPAKFTINGSKGKTTVDADQIVYFRGFGLDEDVGISPIESLRQILKEDFTGSQMREQLMRNGARVSGYLERPADAPDWSGEPKDTFKTDWQAQYSGSGPQAGGTPILEDGMTFKPAAQTAKELQYIEGRKLTDEEVCRSYFIPPPMLGLLEHASLSNIREQHKMLYMDTLGPWLVMFQEEIGLQLVPDFEPTKPRKFYIEFMLREKLSGDFIERGNVIFQATGGPYLTRNEARALDNRPPIEGGDELIVPLNVTQNGDQNPIPAEDPETTDPAPQETPKPKPDPAPDDEED